MNRNGIKLLIFFILTVCILAGLNKFSKINLGICKNEDFYKYSRDYTVLIAGSSHSIMGILPMELWKNYGITAYNMSNYGQGLPVDYWVLKNALNYTTPKLVVLDVFGIKYDEKYSEENIKPLHETFDPMPFSYEKACAVNDLFPKGRRLEFLFPFSAIHSNWSKLDKSYFEVAESTYQKGADENGMLGAEEVEQLVSREYGIKYVPKYEADNVQTTGLDYLKKIIEMLRQEKIEVLLVAIPYAASENDQKLINSIYDLAEEYQVKFINGIEEDIINYNTDLFDIGHLNSSGARKWSNYLGKYILENYGIPQYQNDGRYVYWQEDYEKYLEYKIENFKRQTSLYNYLMLLQDQDFSSCIYVKGNTLLQRDAGVIDLLQNIVQKQEFVSLEEAINNGEDYFMLMDNGWGCVWECIDGNSLHDLNTTFGTVNYGTDKTGRYLYIRDEEINFLESSHFDELSKGEKQRYDLQVNVINKYTGEIVDIAQFGGTYIQINNRVN